MITVGAMTAALPVRSGLQRFSLELLRELLRASPDLIAFASSPSIGEHLGPRVRQTRWKGLATDGFRANLARLVWHQIALPTALRRERASVFYSTLPEGMLKPVCPQVITVLDLLPLRFPESSPRLRHYYRHVLPRLIRASSAVITISEATKCDLQELGGFTEVPVHVVYPGYDDRIFRPVDPSAVDSLKRRLGLHRYVLAVGEMRPYKNIRRLIEAMVHVRDPGLRLAIVGGLSQKDTTIEALPARLGQAGRVVFLGARNDEDLVALYAGAEALVFPSLYEGFGIPPLEAMASGCPVVASQAGPIPEVCGTVAEYVDPREVESIAAGIERVVNDRELRESMRTRGLLRASEFSYSRAAHEVLAVLRQHATPRS